MKLLILMSLVAITFADSSELDNDCDCRIANGENAEPNQFPYQVLLHLLKHNYWYYCGGTLISNQWILTAAHCSQGVSHFAMCLGSIYLDCRDGILLQTSKYFVHEYYKNPTKNANDIALIMLNSPVKTSISIQPAKLPAYSSTPPTYEGKTAVTSGWGYLKSDIHVVSEILQYISVPVISNEECREAGFKENILDTNICIDTNITFKTPCKGDSGGPLVVHNDTLIGIVSFGSRKVSESGLPVVYTRVTSYLNWIKDISGVSTEN